MGKNRKKQKKNDKKKKGALTAKKVDRHELYQAAVQDPTFEVRLASKTFKRYTGRKARSLREDFCGTALLCSEWVKSHPHRTATGVDIDAETLDWGRERNIVPLGDAAERVRLIEGDVRDQDDARHDVVMALNYSYFCFQDRDTLRGYFQRVRDHLVEDGVFLLDLFGGYESVQVLQEKRAVKVPGMERFHYVWDQAEYDPLTAHFLGHIHFRFLDGTELEEAFTYDWRMWSIPELRELLDEAGFPFVEILWEEEDEDGDGTGVFSAVTEASNDPGYNAYLVASANEPKRKAKRRKQK